MTRGRSTYAPTTRHRVIVGFGVLAWAIAFGVVARESQGPFYNVASFGVLSGVGGAFLAAKVWPAIDRRYDPFGWLADLWDRFLDHFNLGG